MSIRRALPIVGLLIAVAGPQGAARHAPRPGDMYGRVSHLGWVVEDAAATAAAWARFGVRDVEPPVVQAFDVTGRDGTRHVRVKKIAARVGTLRVDWMQPLDAGGPLRAFLERHGDGVHHVGYTAPDAARFDREVAELSAVTGGPAGQGTWTCGREPVRFAWFDTATAGGLVIGLELAPPAAPAAARTAPNAEPFTRVTQFAFVVRDAAAASRQMERLGFAPLRIEPNVSLDRIYRGAPGTFEMLLGWDRSGEVPFEWIQPTKGPSVYHESLEAHGEGFHHLGFDVADMDAALARLHAQGLATTMSGGWNVNGHEGRFAYLDAERFGGVTIELLWNKTR